MAQHTIEIRGAREHNLKNIDVTLPREKLVVITGLSGSGKSSLAFDTLYAEGQRRYVESLSAYARQFLEMMKKPDVDSIEGLSPAISIEQKTTSKNPRSTVGTVTEIYDYLRLLFARVGIPYSPATGLPIQAQAVSQMVDRLLEWPEGTKLYLLAPLVRGRKGEYRKELTDLRKQGFQRVMIDGALHELDQLPTLDKQKKHTIDVVVDRFVLAPDKSQRLAEAFETAIKLSDGLAYAENLETGERLTFSSRFSCPVSGFTLDEIEPRLFSFNSPFGACPTCDGLGVQIVFDPEKIVPDPSLSLADGAIAPWAGGFFFYYLQTLESLSHHYGFSLKMPYQDLPEKVKKILLHGSGTESIQMNIQDESRSHRSKKPFEGLIPSLERRWKESNKDSQHEENGRYQTSSLCKACQNYRLKQEALAVKIAGFHIGEVTTLSIQQAYAWFQELGEKLTPQQREIAVRILKEISERLGFLTSVGLGYLSLSRSSGTLSGGESQRIRLASQIGSGLTGVLYVLDEPSIGLHQRDNDRLLETLKRLRDLGNTVIVVEHDEDAMRQADYLVDMGPGAGRHGGQIVAQGTPQEVMDNPESLTGAYLTGKSQIPVPSKRRPGHEGKYLHLEGATAHNLKEVTVDFPLGRLVCVTGVSGGGKSSLVIETLYKALAQIFYKNSDKPGDYKLLEGTEHIDKIIDIDQSPIGRTPRSNPATYTGVFTPIRDWFAALPEAKARGYKASRFSFNVKGGRCEACSGDGMLKIEMHFLPDVYVTCDVCQGKRYSRETLEVRFKQKSIADVLDMTVDEALEFFEAMPSIRDKLQTLSKVGLGYVHVGQHATTLSGGEAQRIKLAKELSKRATGRTLYILDEPTTGLHFEDVKKLLEVLHAFVDQGNTVLVIEHNLEVIKTADWIIDLGPEGGDEGGRIVAQGTPEAVAHTPGSYTGAFLKPYLS
ncbi:MAG: excinuclease ABC subunit UvrA [Alphaproteobacteria bacterium]